MKSAYFGRLALLISTCLPLPALSLAQESSPSPSAPKVVPQTRLEMLRALDALKHRQARLPLPLPPADPNAAPPVVATPAAAAPAAATPGSPGSMGVVNNGRMRSLYLPNELQTRSGQNSPPLDKDLPYDFSTELFWIVSRVNNCHYCLGHQEHKLKSVGVTEQTLLALDTDWSSFPEKQRAAFAFTRQLTLAPQTIADRDIDALRVHFTDTQILDIAFLIGRYNSTNRWTDSLGIPQEDHREFVSTLEGQSVNAPSQVATVGFPARTEFETFASWQAEFDKQAVRKPRLAIPTTGSSTESLPHEALLAAIPAAGEAYVQQLRQARIVGELPQSLRNKIAYVAAREDQAWYMQNLSRQRLLVDGLNDESIFRLGTDGSSNSPEDVALRFAKQLTSQPQSMTDSDIQRLRQHFSPQQVAEIVYHTGLAALLDRLTEVARLSWQ